MEPDDQKMLPPSSLLGRLGRFFMPRLSWLLVFLPVIFCFFIAYAAFGKWRQALSFSIAILFFVAIIALPLWLYFRCLHRFYDHQFKVKSLIIISLWSLLTFCNTWWNQYHYDDGTQIRRNEYIRDIKNIPRFFVNTKTSNMDEELFGRTFRPLTLTSWAMNYAISGADVSSYHVMNYLLHTGTAVLIMPLFTLMASNLIRRRRRPASRALSAWEEHPLSAEFHGSQYYALFAALLFCLHPLASESVNYLSARGDLLAVYFLMISTLLYIESGYNDTGNNPDWSIWPKLRFYIPAIIFYLVATISKDIGITTLGLVVLYDFCFRPVWNFRQYARRIICFNLPFLFVGLGYMQFRKLFLGQFLDNRNIRGLANQLVTQIVVTVKYIQMSFWPFGMNIDHDQYVYNAEKLITRCDKCSLLAKIKTGIINTGLVLQGIFTDFNRFWHDSNTLPVAAYLLILVMIFLLGFYLLWRYRELGWAIFAWFMTLSPTSLVPLKVIMNDHRPYIALIGFALFIAFLFARWTRKIYEATPLPDSIRPVWLRLLTFWPRNLWWIIRNQQVPLPDHIKRRAFAPARLGIYLSLLLILVFCSGVTLARNFVWRNDYTLWKDAAMKSSDKSRPHLNWGLALNRKGLRYEAIQEYNKALELRGDYPLAHNNLGHIYMAMANYDKAIAHFSKIRSGRYYNGAQYHLGRAYWDKGNHDMAMKVWEKLAKKDPSYDQVKTILQKKRKIVENERKRRSQGLSPDEPAVAEGTLWSTPEFQKVVRKLEIGTAGEKGEVKVETSNFNNDETIRVVMLWKEKANRQLKFYWYDPDNTLFHTIPQNIKKNWVKSWCNFFFQNNRKKGLWRMELEMAGKIVYKTSFTILNEPDREITTER
jgi:tetratricopeptide (TPR) repeat protein